MSGAGERALAPVARAHAFVLGLLGCAAAWFAFVAVGASWPALLDHGAFEGAGWDGWRVAALVAGWGLMVVAMMLPTSLPMLALFGRLTSARRDRAALLAIVVGVYLGLWVAIGAAMHLGDLGVHRLVHHWGWLHANQWAIAAGALALAGGYQLSALKRRCAARCRTPEGFIRRHWHGRSAPAETWRLSVDHAASCIGCCWALMLVMFSVGVGSIAWMAALTVVMAAEKTHELGRRLSIPVAVALLAGALVTVLVA
jgi:predicted metal-binding membrane protein